VERLEYDRYAYCTIAGLLRQAGWAINDKRVERATPRVSTGYHGLVAWVSSCGGLYPC
jgi:hypothetical protein